MRRFLFSKARFLSNKVEPVFESPYRIRLRVQNFEVEFFYQKHKLNFWCNCSQGSTLRPCAHMIAGLNYLISYPRLTKLTKEQAEKIKRSTKFTKPKVMSCPEWLKEAYRKAVLNICEECGSHEDEVGKLEPHRIKRGNKGGEYIPRNVKMLCKNCHRLGDSAYHGGEQLIK